MQQIWQMPGQEWDSAGTTFTPGAGGFSQPLASR